MAVAADYYDLVQSLYVAYFGRPADPRGLENYANQLVALNAPTTPAGLLTAYKTNANLRNLVNSFGTSAESQALYGSTDTLSFVGQIYKNVLNRTGDLEGVIWWANEIDAGRVTRANAAAAIMNGALENTTAQGLIDAQLLNNKVDIALNFTAAINTGDELLAYVGNNAAATARNLLQQVAATTDVTAFQTQVNSTLDALVTVATVGQTFTLTSSPDAPVATALDDTFNTTAANLGAFDKVDGLAGKDTLNILDTVTAAGANLASAVNATVTNVETLNVTTTGQVGATGTAYDVSGYTGLTTANFVGAGNGTGGNEVKVANTTAVNVTVVAGATKVTGGTAVTVTNAATAGATDVIGAALTSVSVKGGALATVDNTASDGTSAGGSTLTSVSLNGNTGGAAIKGKGVTTVNVQNVSAAATATITNSTAKHTLNLGLTDAGAAGQVYTVADANAETVNVTTGGTSVAALTTGAANTVLKKVTAAGAGKLTLNLDAANNTAVTSFDGSTATGNLTLTNLAATTTSIKTGAGADTFTVTAATVKDDTSTASVDETVNATVTSGAGNDVVTLTVTGTGKVTVDTGAGDDTLNITSRGTDTLVVTLGDGNDSFSSTPDILATDSVDAGAGKDTLLLSLVGATNIGAFKNFDVFDVKGLSTALDLDILASKNTVTEIVATGDLGLSQTLSNLGAGIGYRVTADTTVGKVQTLTQKTAGALTVTMDIDETGTTAATTTATSADAAVTTTNATSVKAVFDSAFVGASTGAGDNIAALSLTTTGATSVEVASGGANANNQFSLVDSNNKVTSLKVNGAQALSLTATSTSLATIDAAAHTGGLTVALTSVANNGTVILGSGHDFVTVTTASTTGAFESVTGFEKTAAAAVGSDATAAAAAIDDADILSFTGAVAADATFADAAVSKGVLTFTGAGPGTLAEAITIADTRVATAGDTVAFEYLGNTYVFSQGATDIVVRLNGVTGVKNFVEDGTNNEFFIV